MACYSFSDQSDPSGRGPGQRRLARIYAPPLLRRAISIIRVADTFFNKNKKSI
jgi:hypothetical protein